jgi:hypothetical protein
VYVIVTKSEPNTGRLWLGSDGKPFASEAAAKLVADSFHLKNYEVVPIDSVADYMDND